MRLLTLNIRLGAGGGSLGKPAYDIPASEKRDAALFRAIRSTDADVVALQEVRNLRQAEKIAGKLGMSCLYSPHPSSYSLNFFEWGLALLYRCRLVRHGNFAVHFDPDVRSGRNGLWAEFEYGGTAFAVINAHLETRDQAAQLEILTNRVSRTTLPTVIMGDFNISPDDTALRPLKRIMSDSCRAVDTADSREAERVGTLSDSRRRIDYIFTATERFRIQDAGLLPERHRRISDHVGYFADVDLRG